MAYNDVNDGDVLTEADWDSISTHTHSGAARDGSQLDWDTCWTDAVHSHASAAEGGTLTLSTALTDGISPMVIHSSAIVAKCYDASYNVEAGVFSGDTVVASGYGNAAQSTNWTFFTDFAGGDYYYMKPPAATGSYASLLLNAYQSNITKASLYFRYDIMDAQDNFSSTTNWSTTSSSGTASYTVSSNVLTIAAGNGGIILQYDGIDFGSLTVGARYTLLIRHITGNVNSGYGRIGATALYTQGVDSDQSRKIDIIAVATNSVQVFINHVFSQTISGIASGAKLNFEVVNNGAGGAAPVATINLFGTHSASYSSVGTHNIQFDLTNWLAVTDPNGFINTIASPGKFVKVGLSLASATDEVAIFYGFAVQTVI